MSDTTTQPARREITVIKVKSDNGAVGAAHVAVNALKAGRIVSLRAVGAGAVNIAAKAVASAGQIMERELRVGLGCTISMENGPPSPGHDSPVSIVVFTVDTKELS